MGLETMADASIAGIAFAPPRVSKDSANLVEFKSDCYSRLFARSLAGYYSPDRPQRGETREISK